MRGNICLVATLVVLSASLGFAQSAQITIDAARPGIAISPTLYGIFFEEVNMAGDGGLYAELVRNRSFEDTDKPDPWSLTVDGDAKGEIAVDTQQPVSAKNPHSLRLTCSNAQGRVGVVNNGYFGIALQNNAVYKLSFMARAQDSFAGSLHIALEDTTGKQIYASAEVSGLTSQWKPFTCELTSKGTDPKSRLVIRMSQLGTVWLDMVSLFQKATWRQKPNGFRSDLADMVAGLRPSFMRFPGGCWVEGDTIPQAMRWKATIGDISERRTQWCLWKYHSTNGLGYHEYLQLCEDIGAEPLFVINCGMSHQGNVPLNKMSEWVQDALDAIEYANGPADSHWGSLRAKAGHSKPFGLKYLEIGNENGGKAYMERYPLFHDAIKAKYPEIHLIANYWENKAPTNRPVEIIDEHYYADPGFFIANANRYDTYDRKGPKVYVGEYAVTQGCGAGDLRAAVAEAAFMTGMERNSDVVVLASYAPLFVNVNSKIWNPDLINFDTSRVYGTPSYYVQKMFSEHRGNVVLPTTIAKAGQTKQSQPKPGKIGLGTWATQAEFKDISVTQGDKVLFAADFTNGMTGWTAARGQWAVADGALRQTSNELGPRMLSTIIDTGDYTLRLKARKLGGSEGFLITFRMFDDDNWAWWNLGGWANKSHGIEQSILGTKSIIGATVPAAIETGRWYDIRIATEGRRVRCFLDGKQVHDIALSPWQSPQPLYAVASRVDATGEILLKVANVSPSAQDTQIEIQGVSIQPSAKLVVLTSDKPNDENSLDNPNKVTPVSQSIDNASSSFRHVFPATSVTILRLKRN